MARMVRKESLVTRIGGLTSKRFPSLSAAGTGTEELVRFILTKRNQLKNAKRQKIGMPGTFRAFLDF